MNILAIETATKTLSVALLMNDELIGEFNINTKLNHSVKLLPMIDDMFKYAGKSLDDVDYIAVSSGPGSFTGLRIGGSTAKALAHGKGIKVIDVSTLEALAYNCVRHKGLIIPILDARRNTVFTQVFESDGKRIKAISKIEAMEINLLLSKYADNDVIFVGDGIKLISDDNINKVVSNPSAASVAIVGSLSAKENKNIYDYDTYEPFYLKKSQAQREYEEKTKVIREAIEDDIEAIHKIELNTADDPWSKASIIEDFNNKLSRYFVVEVEGVIVAYISFWYVVNELHITNVAVLPTFQRQKIGTMLIDEVIKYGIDNETIGIQLEVSTANIKAIELYKKYDFELETIRKNYYAKTNEDAMVMWKHFDK